MAKLTIGILLCVLSLLSVPADAASGGRSGGGSFERSEPAPSRDYNRSEPAPSRDYSREPSYYRDNYSNYRQTDSYSGTGSDSEMPFGVSLALGLFCIVFLLGGLAVNNTFAKTQEGGNLPLAPDLRNDRVTISKIQIALYATARSIQGEIRQLSEMADLNTKEGLRHFLREALLILRRNADAWCYALGDSKFYDRAVASEQFDALSTAERMKFSTETFSRMANQRMIKREYENNAEVPEFIIVTVLIGTEHDKPLFPPIKTRQDVENAINACLAITATYLLTVEVLWTPDSDRDSLTKDDLLRQYTDLVAL
jgi:uncharacterized membrane protein